ncbi:hypothetical protein [Rhodococcus sp. IEGM 1330]|uniref:hypothetical protein n=1 Tax=Rhodococcus sp. IEGM 1330 TaxID=3082225 RepID=UPI002954B17C|nr:hypothetical protein [Rhodococcus sp. IEGM 1330]MDV8023397.1 hypothetical protein [Rhodococcus sp. IEGM 1330]
MTADALRRATATFEALAAKFENQDTDPNADNPRVYWTLGRGAVRIAWGFAGDFERCTDLVGKHVERAEGLCASYHKDLFGTVPKESTQAAKPELPAEWDFDAELPEDALPSDDEDDANE